MNSLRFDAHFQSINPTVVCEKHHPSDFPRTVAKLMKALEMLRGENFRLRGDMVQNLAQFQVKLTKTLIEQIILEVNFGMGLVSGHVLRNKGAPGAHAKAAKGHAPTQTNPGSMGQTRSRAWRPESG